MAQLTFVFLGDLNLGKLWNVPVIVFWQKSHWETPLLALWDICTSILLSVSSKCQALTSSPSGSSSCAILLSHLQCIVTWLLVCLLAFRTFTATVICMRATDSRTSFAFHRELPPSLVYQDPHPFPVVLEVTNLHSVPYDLPVLDISCTWGHTVWDLWYWLHLASLPGLSSWKHE